jgi:hypothetical protein
MAVWTAMWHIFTVPRNDSKIQKMSDTWKPLVLPCHHADINMTHVSSYVCHVRCMDANISSMDADSSPANWDRLTKP